MTSDIVCCKYTMVYIDLRDGTGSKIFFRAERRIGGGFQKKVLRKIVVSLQDERAPGDIDLEIRSYLV